jgi:predicted DNA-binding transcriptional regulator AlpA
VSIRKPIRLREVSEATGIPEGTLRYFRSVGKGPRSFKLGRAVVYDEADVIAWIEEQREASQQGSAT